MASAEREAITGVWGQSPQRGPGAEPLVRGSGGEAPLKLRAFSLMYTSLCLGKLALSDVWVKTSKNDFQA